MFCIGPARSLVCSIGALRRTPSWSACRTPYLCVCPAWTLPRPPSGSSGNVSLAAAVGRGGGEESCLSSACRTTRR